MGSWEGRTSSASRGYGSKHQRLRAWWAKRVEQGNVYCWRCRELIAADAEWELGHDDEARTKYRGPEHRVECNQRAGASKGGRSSRATRLPERPAGLLTDAELALKTRGAPSPPPAETA
jgi:hypothetical protein